MEEIIDFAVYSKSNPGLIVLLTDESETSVEIVNKFIDRLIQMNFDGDSPINRFFLVVIGYGNGVRRLCSGYLSELDSNPVEIEKQKRKISYGLGSVAEVEISLPKWIYFRETIFPCDMVELLKITDEIVFNWRYDNIPFVIDIGCKIQYGINNVNVKNVMEKIKRHAFVFGYSLIYENCYSRMPSNCKNIYAKQCSSLEDGYVDVNILSDLFGCASL